MPAGMNEWIAQTRSVLAAFPAWPAEVRCLDLTEEVGELARAVLVAERRKPGGQAEPVVQALCGVLVDLFALAGHYRVDLDGQYGQQLAAFACRAGTSARSAASPRTMAGPAQETAGHQHRADPPGPGPDRTGISLTVTRVDESRGLVGIGGPKRLSALRPPKPSRIAAPQFTARSRPVRPAAGTGQGAARVAASMPPSPQARRSWPSGGSRRSAAAVPTIPAAARRS